MYCTRGGGPLLIKSKEIPFFASRWSTHDFCLGGQIQTAVGKQRDCGKRCVDPLAAGICGERILQRVHPLLHLPSPVGGCFVLARYPCTSNSTALCSSRFAVFHEGSRVQSFRFGLWGSASYSVSTPCCTSPRLLGIQGLQGHLAHK